MKYNKTRIIKELRVLGFKKGDIVILHSSLASIGYVEGGADTVIDAFLDVLGSTGTLVVPVFGKLGIITEVVKARNCAVVSEHPFAAVAAIGKEAKKICAEHWKCETAHGAGTPYLKIAELGGKICLLGVDQDRNTTMHSVEALLRLPYLSTVSGKVSTPEGEIEKSWDFFPGPHRDFIGLDKYLRASGKMVTGKIGNAVVRVIKSKDMIDICYELGMKNPAFCLCNNPNCADCVSQRAKIFASKIANESFTLATSAVLAGRYVPEITENMKNSGISKLELDYIEGMPVSSLAPEKLKRVICELTEKNCEILSLRSCVVDTDYSSFLKIAAKNGIAKVVFPVNENMEAQIKCAAENNLPIAFYNTVQSSDFVSSLLLKLKEKEITPEFVFNPANFAACGEKPFLTSYRKKLKRYIGQVDIEDMTFTGETVSLARGNAEIKEIISILRCAGFSGTFLLAARNRFIGSLREISAEFDKLLDNI